MLNHLFNDIIKWVSNPKKFSEFREVVSQLETTLGKNFNKELVVMTKSSYENLLNNGSRASGTLNIINSKHKQSTNTSTNGLVNNNALSADFMYDHYEGDSYYDDDLLLNNVSQDSDQFELSKHSVYNFAVLYLFGNKNNNIVTIFSLDENSNLYINEQKQYKVTTHLDVIDVCDAITDKYELDTIIFVETDVIKSIYANVVPGINNHNVTTCLCREFLNFDDGVDELVPLLNNGGIFVNQGQGWYLELQMEINKYFVNTRPSPMQKITSSITFPYPKLKSMIYGVNYWHTHKNTDKLQRNLNAE